MTPHSENESFSIAAAANRQVWQRRILQLLARYHSRENLRKNGKAARRNASRRYAGLSSL